MPHNMTSEVVAASLGGAVSASVLYPLEVLKTKMQADDDDDDKGMIAYARALYEKEGMRVFFKGMETSAFQSSLEKALYFFAYTALKQIHAVVTKSPELGGLSNLLLGAAAEWAHLPVTLPVDAWTTKIQTTKDAPLKILLTMLSKRENYYKGISAYALLCWKPSLQYTVYEQVKKAWVATRVDKSLTAIEAFVLGMVARTIATVVVFPFVRAKVLMQTSSAEGGSTNVKDLLLEVYEKDGMAGLFKGLGPELTRGIFSAALMLMIKEKIGDIVDGMLEGRKLR